MPLNSLPRAAVFRYPDPAAPAPAGRARWNNELPLTAPRNSLRGLARTAALLLLLAPLASCSSHAPAIRTPALAASMPAALQGPLKVTFTAPLVGSITTRMTARPSASGFIASTRSGIAWEFVGGVEGLLGRVFLPKLFPDGVILTWSSALPTGDSPATGHIGAGKFRSAAVTTRLTSFDSDIEILTPDGRRIATMRIEREDADAPPPSDYPALADRIATAFKAGVYDRSVASSFQAGRYLAQVRSSARIARDDVEFIFGSAIAGRNVKSSLPLVLRNAEMQAPGALAARGDLPTISVSFDPVTSIASLRFDAFLGAADVDAAFEEALAFDPAGLFIDLRNCPGVTLASLRVLSWVCDQPVDAGVFFGQRQRAAALKSGRTAFAEHAIDSASSIATIEAALDANGAARIRVQPVARAFHGPVAVRISSRTTTSAEPLADILKRTGRARIFGESTAGRPYLSRPLDIGQGWVLWLATCDYRGPAGERISAKGVRPDVEAARTQSRSAAIAWLGTQTRQELEPESTSASATPD
jgi:hypothetical protein